MYNGIYFGSLHGEYYGELFAFVSGEIGDAIGSTAPLGLAVSAKIIENPAQFLALLSGECASEQGGELPNMAAESLGAALAAGQMAEGSKQAGELTNSPNPLSASSRRPARASGSTGAASSSSRAVLGSDGATETTGQGTAKETADD